MKKGRKKREGCHLHGQVLGATRYCEEFEFLRRAEVCRGSGGSGQQLGEGGVVSGIQGISEEQEGGEAVCWMRGRECVE